MVQVLSFLTLFHSHQAPCSCTTPPPHPPPPHAFPSGLSSSLRYLHQSAWAATAKYHRLGSPNNRQFSLMVAETDKSEVTYQQMGCLVRALFLVCRWPPAPMSSPGGEGPLGSSFSYQGTNPVMERHPHLNLIFSPKPSLQIPLHWGLGLQHKF